MAFMRCQDDNLEMEAQLGAMNVQLQSLRELVANLRRQVDAEKETVTELQVCRAVHPLIGCVVCAADMLRLFYRPMQPGRACTRSSLSRATL